MHHQARNSWVGRTDIIDALTEALVRIDYIQAFWEGGAATWGRVDEWSDIDGYLLVDDGKIQDAFEEVEGVLRSLSPIKQKYSVTRNAWPGISQAFYRLENANPYLVIDLGIMTSSSPDNLLEPEIHGTSIFYFNKRGIKETPRIDMIAFEKRRAADLEWTRERFEMFSNYVEKETRRGNSLEALEYYRAIIIPSLVQALRAKHTPMHYDFRTRYIHYELPRDVVQQLEELCFVSGPEELEAKSAEAIRWFNELASLQT